MIVVGGMKKRTGLVCDSCTVEDCDDFGGGMVGLWRDLGPLRRETVSFCRTMNFLSGPFCALLKRGCNEKFLPGNVKWVSVDSYGIFQNMRKSIRVLPPNKIA